MSMLVRAAILASMVLVAGPPAASAQAVTACGGDDLLCLDQNWGEAERSMWYTMSQGSRLLPLSWARQLRTADDSRPFFGTEHLQSLGYLPNPVSAANPEGLPVGFAVDRPARREPQLMCDRFPRMCAAQTMREPWLGLNCAACHTAEITYRGQRVRIDGAPAMANFDLLVNGVEESLRAIRDDEARLARFAQGVGARTPDAAASLRAQMGEQLAWMGALRHHNDGAVVAGPGRLDAQGHILTKVAMVNGALSQPDDFKADAPASYPFIWNTHQQDKLQWNGIAGSIVKLRIFSRNTDVGALVRNVSEVIGVFAQIEANRPGPTYPSSVRVLELVSLERVLERLESPVWPAEVLGPVDEARAAAGRDLFVAHCRECHADLAPGDQRSPARIVMEPLATAGTDVFLACNTYLRTANAGGMAGKRMFAVAGERIFAVDYTRKMLVNAAAGAMVKQWRQILISTITDMVPPPLEGLLAEVDLGDATILPGVTDETKRARARQCLSISGEALLAYKARPLNGIWATAPYLHNGSVPTLYDLLLPPGLRNVVPAGETDSAPDGPLRPEQFTLGTKEFDPVKVGYATNAPDSHWTFRVRDEEGAVVPGNSNAGHDYGNAGFSEADRMAIVEYLKSL